MGGQIARTRSRSAWRLVEAQHGVITRSQLLSLGFSRHAVDHRIATGRLRRIHQGVYAVGWPQLTPHRMWVAAVLACAPSAVLSHHSAAALWGIAQQLGGSIEVSVRSPNPRRRPGIRVVSRPSLADEDVTSRDAIPVTAPGQTLIDLATLLSRSALERAVNEADKLDLIDPDQLRKTVDRCSGRPGVRALRSLLDRDTFRASQATHLPIALHGLKARKTSPNSRLCGTYASQMTT